jgi:hypothetical protein
LLKKWKNGFEKLPVNAGKLVVYDLTVKTRFSIFEQRKGDSV